MQHWVWSGMISLRHWQALVTHPATGGYYPPCPSDRLTWERTGRIVTPEWPPITGTSTAETLNFLASATNVFDRTTSSVVTPKILLFFPTNRIHGIFTLPLRIVTAGLLKHLCCYGYGGVDWVGDDAYHGQRAASAHPSMRQPG